MGRPKQPDSPRVLYPAEYWTWQNIKRRCEGRGKSGPAYVAKGIAVCPRWQSSFETFLGDMGPRPRGDKYAWAIERVDNSRGYEPGNCRWATPQEQATNRDERLDTTRARAARVLLDAGWHRDTVARALGISPVAVKTHDLRRGTND